MGSLVSPLLENPSWIALLLGYSLAASGSLRVILLFGHGCRT